MTRTRAPDRGRRAGAWNPPRGAARVGLVLLLAGLGACREPEGGQAREVSREQFIETYVALLRVEAQAADSVEARQRKAWVLERRGLTAADLERFARRHGDDPASWAEIWREIESRLRALQGDPTKPHEDAERE